MALPAFFKKILGIGSCENSTNSLLLNTEISQEERELAERREATCITTFLNCVCEDIESHPSSYLLVRKLVLSGDRERLHEFVNGRMARWHVITIDILKMTVCQSKHFPQIKEEIIVDQIIFCYSYESN